MALLSVTALVGLAVAGSASAVTRAHTKPIPGRFGESTAKCPNGTHVLSGGGDAGGEAYLYESRKRKNGWRVGGDDPFSGGSGYPLTAYAYCGRHNLHLRTFRKAGSGNPNTSAIAHCGSGHIVSGGGLVNSAEGLVYGDQKSGNGWLFAADTTPEGGGPVHFVTYAYCTPQQYHLVTRHQEQTSSGAAVEMTVPCPSGKKAVSGGGFGGASGYFYRLRKSQNGWLGTAAILFPYSSSTVSIEVYCH